MGYGSDPMGKAPRGQYPPPPPPDGKPPVRLPIGANLEQPQEPAGMPEQPMAGEDVIMQLMRMLGRVDGA